MTAEPKIAATLPTTAGLPSHAEALAVAARARRLRAETLAGLARAALSWARHRAGRAGATATASLPAGGMPHARA
jgi:hypothetical protein